MIVAMIFSGLLLAVGAQSQAANARPSPGGEAARRALIGGAVVVSWTQAGPIVGNDSLGAFDSDGEYIAGVSVALSGSGTTLAIGGPGYTRNYDYFIPQGGIWVFVRTPAGAWVQQGPTLTLKDPRQLGNRISLDFTGNTLAAPYSEVAFPAGKGCCEGTRVTAIFKRSARGVWALESNVDGISDSVLSGRGDTLAGLSLGGIKAFSLVKKGSGPAQWLQLGREIKGGSFTAPDLDQSGETLVTSVPFGKASVADAGGVVVYKRPRGQGGVWVQQTPRLVSNNLSGAALVDLSLPVAVSGDGKTIASGALSDNAIIMWALSKAGKFVQQGAPLTSLDATPGSVIGNALALNNDGSVLAAGIPYDGANVLRPRGAVSIFVRSSKQQWSQQGAKLVGARGADPSDLVGQGFVVAVGASGKTVVSGAPYYGKLRKPAAWVFSHK